MPSLYNRQKFNPARGGHAPGHIRDAFIEAIEAYQSWGDGEPEPTVEVGYNEVTMPISAVCGLVWSCTDIMPGDACDTLAELRPWPDTESPLRRVTYACGARLLKDLIQDAKAEAA